MEYQKIINLLDKTHEPSKFRTRNWIKINNESQGTYITDQIKFKNSMMRTNICDYSDAYIHIKGTIRVPNTGTAAAPNNRNKNVIFKHYPPFINYISEINNTQVDDVHDIDVVISMYNLIQHSDTYSKTSGILLQCYRDEPAQGDNGNIIDFSNDNNISTLFKSKH